MAKIPDTKNLLYFVAGFVAAAAIARYTDEGRRIVSGGNKFFTSL